MSLLSPTRPPLPDGPLRGVRVVELDSWDAFVQLVQREPLDHRSLVWRGQRCDTWLLEPTIDRKASARDPAERYTFYKDQLERFKHAVRGRRGANPPQLHDDNAWWALGQHNGLATPLLDWTTSPFVAAFFAFFEHAEPQTPRRAIYALHQPAVERVVSKRKIAETLTKLQRKAAPKIEGQSFGLIESVWLDAPVEPEIEFVRPLSDENHRLLNQGGLFTRCNTGSPIEQWVHEHHEPALEHPTLVKYLIPDSDRVTCLKSLNRMNINPLSLLPDLTGASIYCNLHFDIEGY